MPRDVYYANMQANFGDQLTPLLLGQIAGIKAEWAKPVDADLVVVGSVLDRFPPGWTGTVAGAGKMHPARPLDLSHARVLGLRGHLTALDARISQDDVVFGDPGLLAVHVIQRPRKTIELGIVPHWSDKKLALRFLAYGGTFIDVFQDPVEVITQIASCKEVVASSLHGLIVADAFGIPRRAELFDRAVREGGDFKFKDYASALGVGTHFGEMFEAPQDRVHEVQVRLREMFSVI